MKFKIKKPTADNNTAASENAEAPAKKFANFSDKNVGRGTGFTKRLATKIEKQIEEVTEEQETTKRKFTFKKPVAKQPQVLALTKTEDGIVLDESQQYALDNLVKEKFGCLIGSAGTGKTTILKRFLSSLENQYPMIHVLKKGAERGEDGNFSDDDYEYRVPIAICAFTGRAVQQVRRALDEKYHELCSTIHSLLGFYPDWYEDFDDDGNVKTKVRFIPYYTMYNKLPHKVIIVEESGMCPVPLWNQLFEALQPGTRIFFVGDINQLPPVQGKSVLGFAMIKWPTFALEKIHRQAEDNPIIANAHNILHGKLPVPNKKAFAMMKIDDGSVKAQQQILKTIMHLSEKKIFDPYRDALIVPQNVGNLGQETLNSKLVTYFNPTKDENGNVINKRWVIKTGAGSAAFAVGDKVMLLKNIPDTGLTNGMVGIVDDIVKNGQFKGGDMEISIGDLDSMNLDELHALDDKEEEKEKNERQASHIMHVRFGYDPDDPYNKAVGKETLFSTAGDYNAVSHAYASTCHKMQGGECPVIVIAIHSTNSVMLCREWFYTAVTRAREKVIVLYNDRGLLQSVNIQRIKGRTVAEKAEKFIALSGNDDETLPDLPEPEKWSV